MALEHDDFESLPSGFYLKALVRAYAREVRVDPEPLVEWLRREQGELIDEAMELSADAPSADAHLSAVAPTGAKADEPVFTEPARRPATLSRGALALVVALAVAGGMLSQLARGCHPHADRDEGHDRAQRVAGANARR